jgi:hypothetical protein
MGKTYLGKHLAIWPYKIGNGSKQFGLTLWFNSQRVGADFKFWVWELSITWDFK